jgi:hypothetical protein
MSWQIGKFELVSQFGAQIEMKTWSEFWVSFSDRF